MYNKINKTCFNTTFLILATGFISMAGYFFVYFQATVKMERQVVKHKIVQSHIIYFRLPASKNMVWKVAPDGSFLQIKN